ncbi:hypothetical protein [Paenibacillus sp. YN15]|uniref:hypothetical protein n=1 Tax=Paenibacillus sp. YN15 TaxID=1742774 RepID=UPI000DCBF647|nr:hypothetical protein [Paenibacillus sp. YN15]RAU99799.1 hypothetical protein DQG13_14945 [Paenibacillus sp. YN15]
MHIRGIILEGYSNSGKTSLLKALKLMLSQDEGAERSLVVLGEHYSQILNDVNGEFVSLGRLEHVKLLQERADMLKKLNEWAVGLGPFSRRSRGLFFILERFHLNHRAAFSNSLDKTIEALEQSLIELGAKCVLLTVSDAIVEERIMSRDAGLWKGKSQEEITKACRDLIDTQNLLREQARISKVPTMELNTDAREWEKYAKEIMEYVDS